MAARRSVSFTRQLPILVRVVGPSANSATIASVIAASGIARQSIVPPRNTVRPRSSIQSAPKRTSAPRRASSSANPTSPWIESRPTPVTRTGPPPSSAGREEIRRARRVAFDRQRAGTAIAAHSRAPEGPPAVDGRPRRRSAASGCSVMSTYGREISSPSMLTRTSARSSGNACSSPVRNWLDTSPRMRTGAACGVPGPMRTAESHRPVRNGCRRPAVAARRRGRRSDARASAARRRRDSCRRERECGHQRAHRQSGQAEVQIGRLPGKHAAGAVELVALLAASRPSMPSARSASSITRVSSDSSSPVSVVVPRASAASSSVRLEMLFEPGNATTPSA